MSNVKMDFWGEDGQERLSCSDMDDAIEEALENIDDLKDFPKELEIIGFARMDPNPETLAEHVLERTIECLDEDLW